MLICGACNAENRDTAKFCRHCGGAIAERSENLTIAKVGAFSDDSRMVDEEVSQPPVAVADRASCSELAQAATTVEPCIRTDFGDLERPRDPSVSASNGVELSTPSTPVEETISQVAVRPRSRPKRSLEDHPERARPTCPSCGSNVRSLDKFCIWCGQRQPERDPADMKRCPDCGTVLPVAANFCFACGHDVEEYRSKKIRFPTELFEESDPDLVPKFEA